MTESEPLITIGQHDSDMTFDRLQNLVSYYKNGGFLWDAQIQRRMNSYMGATIRRIA